MEIPRKQIYKKRKTRKNLDEIKKRSKKDGKFMSPTCERKSKRIKKTSKIVTNEQITSNRLTLALFKKAVQSETITRLPSKIINQKLNSSNNISSSNKQFLKSKAGIKMAYTKLNVDIAINSCNADSKTNTKINEVKNYTPDSTTVLSPMKSETDNDSNMNEYKPEYLSVTSSSCKSSDIEPEHCYYEKFLNELPQYIREHFPALTGDAAENKKSYELKQIFLGNCQKFEYNKFRHFQLTSKNFELSHKLYKDTIIQNPMDYIQKGLSWQQSIQPQQTTLVSNHCSSTLSQFKPNMSNFVYESPEYMYFPHKLN